MLKAIVESVNERYTSDQLDRTFDALVRAASMRSAQGLGTDEGLNEMLATITNERNTRPIRG